MVYTTQKCAGHSVEIYMCLVILGIYVFSAPVTVNYKQLGQRVWDIGLTYVFSSCHKVKVYQN